MESPVSTSRDDDRMGDGAPPVPGPAVDGARRRRRLPVLALVTYGSAQLVLLFWWAACFPGRFSPDSLDYMWQSTTGNWNTHHPISYTALVWLSLQLTGGVAALTLAQTVAMAAGLAYAVTGLRRLGGPAWAWAVAAVTVVVLPPVGVFLMCVWKDVAFVICHVFLLGTLARLIAHRRGGGHSLPLGTVAVPLLIELTLIGLFRQNGFISVLIAVTLSLLVMRGARLRLAVTGAAAVSVALLTNWLLLPTLGVRESESIVAFESFFSDIAVAYRDDPASFPPADTAVMARVAPLEHWRTSATCYQVDPTVYGAPFDRRAAAVHREELLTVWWHVAQRSPGTILESRICRGSVAWRPTATGGWLSRNPSGWKVRQQFDIFPKYKSMPYEAAVYHRPLHPRIALTASWLGKHLYEPEWLMWRGAAWAYITYLVVGLAAWRRRDRQLLVLATATVGVQVSVLLFNAVQAARYMTAPYVLGVLILPLALTARRTGGGPVAVAVEAPRQADTGAKIGPGADSEAGPKQEVGPDQAGPEQAGSDQEPGPKQEAGSDQDPAPKVDPPGKTAPVSTS